MSGSDFCEQFCVKTEFRQPVIMGPTGTLIWIFSLAAVCVCKPPDVTCTSPTQLLEQLSAGLKEAAECSETLRTAWSFQQSSALLVSMKNLTDLLHKNNLKECPAAEAPENGGLVCVTLGNKRYCKPLCNHGFDFGFMRRSRLFDECSQETRFKWDTQYVGGNRLAVCDASSTQIAGASSAYFPKDSSCLTTKSQTEVSFIERSVAELQRNGGSGVPEDAFLVCG